MTNQTTSRKTTKSTQSVVANSRRKRVARQLAAYSIAAGAGVAGAENAAAAPIPVNLPGGGPFVITDENIVDLDLDDDGNVDFTILNYLGLFGASIQGENSLNTIDADDFYLGSYLATLIGAGELIDGSSVGGFGYIQFADLDNFLNTRGFVGLEFDIPGGSPHFAYLDISTDTSDNTVTIHGGAYESQTGVGIRAVPEPTGLGLLAMGAVGAAAWRRRREDVAS